MPSDTTPPSTFVRAAPAHLRPWTALDTLVPTRSLAEMAVAVGYGVQPK